MAFRIGYKARIRLALNEPTTLALLVLGGMALRPTALRQQNEYSTGIGPGLLLAPGCRRARIGGAGRALPVAVG